MTDVQQAQPQEQEQEKPMTVPQFLGKLKAAIGDASHNFFNIYNGVEATISNLYNEIIALAKENQALKAELETLKAPKRKG